MRLRIAMIALAAPLVGPGTALGAGVTVAPAEKNTITEESEPEPGPAVPRAVAPDRSIQKVRPKSKIDHERRLGPPPPEAVMHKKRDLQFKAHIETFTYDPGSIGQVADGVIAPGGYLTLFGVGFGDEMGEVDMWGNASELRTPNGRLDPRPFQWSDTRIRLEVWPKMVRGPLHRSSIWLAVRPKAGDGSVPFQAPFEVPAIVRSITDAGVAASVDAVHCSDNANENDCDGTKVRATHENIMVPHNPFDTDDGVDRWRIQLFEDWVFADSHFRVPRGEASIGSKPTPEGSDWEGTVSWACDIQETTEYELDVKVKRARAPIPWGAP